MSETFTDSLFDATVKAHENGRPVVPLPTSLYHFTDVRGLHAIVTNKTIRVSLSTALNDASEGVYGLKLAHELLRRRPLASGSFEDALVKIIEDPKILPRPLHYDMFPMVACFCGSDDTSSQWMHYGRSGRGVAIGFNPKFLATVSTGMVLRKVDYDLDSQRKRIQAIVDSGKRAWEVKVESMGGNQAGVLVAAHVTWIALSLLAPELKDPSFDSEDEWRLLGHQLFVNGVLHETEGATPGPLMLAHTDDGRLVAYEDLAFPRFDGEPIETVTVGYSSPVDMTAVKLLLFDNKFRARVSRSTVPVR